MTTPIYRYECAVEEMINSAQIVINYINCERDEDKDLVRQSKILSNAIETANEYISGKYDL